MNSAADFTFMFCMFLLITLLLSTLYPAVVEVIFTILYYVLSSTFSEFDPVNHIFNIKLSNRTFKMPDYFLNHNIVKMILLHQLLWVFYPNF